MRKLIVSEFMSLDGVIQALGGRDEDLDGGFGHGGWTIPYWHDDIGASFGALMQDVDANKLLPFDDCYLRRQPCRRRWEVRE